MSDKYVGFSPQTNKLPQQDPIPLSVVERTDDGRIKAEPATQDDDVVNYKQSNDKALAEHGDMTGVISSFAATIAPDGWLKANGAELLRADYPELWAYAQASGNLVAQGSKEAGNFGDGDGSTTFTLPDIRGEFIRGFDDGRGVDTGRAIGSFQDWAIKDHEHDIAFSAAGGGLSTVFGGKSTGSADKGALIPAYNGGVRTAINVGSSTVPPEERVSPENISGDELRPRNIALLYCIKY
jgi:phage-related tail fiber protein